MRLALAMASFVILVVHGIIFYDQFFHQWESYQTSYFQQALSLAKTDAERAAVAGRAPKIEQIIVTSFGETRVDRCSTCHIGIDDPRFLESGHPLRAHPFSEELGDKLVDGKWVRRHKFNDFGCTVCHDGQGRGLEGKYAHGQDHFWPDPLLGSKLIDWRADYKPKLVGREYMQANCTLCHTDENFGSTPLVAQGRRLFFGKNCYGCHKIEGLSNGALGPELSEVGKKFKIDYLWESIVDPRANSPASFMPKFNLTDDEVKALTIFLKSRRGMNFSETSLDRYRATLTRGEAGPALVHGGVVTTPPEGGTPGGGVAYGERLVYDKSCMACHKLGKFDGGIAPDLSFQGLLRDENWMMEHFRSPRARISDSIMPAFGFSDGEYQAMTTYLASLRTPPAIGSPAEIYTNLCARCHGDKGDGHGQIAVYLDPYPRDLTKAGFMNSKPLERHIASIRSGVAGTSMPAWGRVLTDDQIRGVLDYIQTNFVGAERRPVRERKIPEANPVAYSSESVNRGEATYLQRCTGCHGRKADGKGPNSLDMLPRPRNLRNRDFLNSVSDRRLFESLLYGVQGTAMPPWIDYGLTEKEIGDLVNYLRSFEKGHK